MSNYANTKATIAANVYTNHANQVTAEMVKTAINSVVDTLIAGGYLYKGVAHPGDAAETPDANVFYLATEVGTYTNKGGLQVADGEVAVLKYNGSWTKEVTGAATAAEVTALGQKVDGLALGKFYGFFPDVADLPAGDEPGYAYVGASSSFAIYVFKNGAWSDSGTVQEPSEGNGEDIDTNAQGKLQFADRPNTDGMGYIILRKNKTFAEQVTTGNTIYEIRYDFDLGGASVTIPAGCVLKFVGGKLSNGELSGNSTKIESAPVQIFDTIDLAGDFVSPEWYGEWFGAKESLTDNSAAFNDAIKQVNSIERGGVIRLLCCYQTMGTIFLRPNVGIVGETSDITYRNDGTKARAGFIYTGSNPNVWVLDSKPDDNYTILPYNQLGEETIEGGVSLRRNVGFPLRGFIVSTTTQNTFGGIRLIYHRRKEISDIFVSSTKYGIACSFSWSLNFQNVQVACSTLGFFFGNDSTTITMTDCGAGGSNDLSNTIATNFSDAIFGESNDHTPHLPPYISIDTACVLTDDRSDTAMGLKLIGFSFEGYDAALLCGGLNGNKNRSGIAIVGPYFERISKTIFWAYNAVIDAKTPVVFGCPTRFHYMFGTYNGAIVAENYPQSTCYPGVLDSARSYYTIKISSSHSLPCYYDTYEISNGDVINCALTRAKEFVLECPYLSFTNNDTLHDDFLLAPPTKVALGVGRNYGTASLSNYVQIINSLRNKSISTIMLQGKMNAAINTGVVYNKELTIWSPMIGNVGLEIYGCEVYLPTDGGGPEGAAYFKIKGGKNRIIINKNLYWGCHIVCIDSEEHIDVFIKNIGAYTSNRYVLNETLSNIRNTYYIVYEEADGTQYIYTNMRGTTANRPGTPCVGQEYFDTTLGKKIVWNGSAWVNMDGTALS